MIRTVLFDLMGTLLVRGPGTTADPADHFYRVLQEAGLPLGREEFWVAVSQTPPRATQGPLTPFEDRLIRLCAGAGLSIGHATASDMAQSICSNSNRVVVTDPDAVDVIQALRRLGQVGLVTNYDHPPNIHLLLEREALRQYFDVVVISGELGVWKPDPAILRAAMVQLGVEPAEAVYVGDSDIDIQAACDAGMSSVLIRRPGHASDPLRDPHPPETSARPDRTIARLSALPEELAALQRPS